jgi:1-acyl-sn-glycerol-3-phosphate acyltransferase
LPAELASVVVWTEITALMSVALAASLPLWVASQGLGLDRRRRRIFALHMALGRAVVRLNPFWNVRVIGPERPPEGVYVVCINHLSNADIFCLSFLRDAQWRYIAKRELLRVPLFGWLMQLAGHVPVERGQRTSGAHALASAREALDDGISMAFFPEGTRSETGQIKEFKMGAFKLAVEAGVPVLPIAVSGTQTALPKFGWVMRERADVKIRILDPIPPGADPEALRDRTRAILIGAKAELDAL